MQFKLNLVLFAYCYANSTKSFEEEENSYKNLQRLKTLHKGEFRDGVT